MHDNQREHGSNFTERLHACGDHFSKSKIETNCLTDMNKLVGTEGGNILK